MPEIQSLALRVRDLTQSVDRWNTVMLWALIFAAIAAIAVVLATRIVVTHGKKLADAQTDLINAKDTKLSLDLKAKDGEIAGAVKNAAEANERATKAQASLSLAEQHAAEANAKAEGFRLDISQANERAASANETAERERLARLQLEARLADRVLTPAQQTSISTALRPLGAFPAQIFTYSDITEVVRIGQAIGSTLLSAGWAVTSAAATGGISVTGIVVAIGRNATPAVRISADRLVAELLRNGIGATRINQPMEDIPLPGMTFGNTDPNAQIRILIGTK